MEILESNDLKHFDELYWNNFAGEFPQPNTNNLTTVRTIFDKEKVVASGVVKLFAEAIIVTDKEASKKQRIKAIDMLMMDMLAWCEMYGVEQVHAFVKTNFARFLSKRYGFEPTKEISLVLNLGE